MGRGARAAALASVLLLLVGTGCTPAGDDVRADADAPAAEEVVAASGAPQVRIEGSTIVLAAAGDDHVVATLADGDGAAVHAALRPTDTDRHTVLVLTRVADGPGRYELRYVTVDLAADGISHTDLYWFPLRSQVDEVSAAILDVPPVPVWSPDGRSLAWIEWNEDGTRLRTVGWYHDGAADNPSDIVATYRLDDIPVGTQLERWLPPEQQLDAVLVARGADDARYRIEVADDPT